MKKFKFFPLIIAITGMMIFLEGPVPGDSGAKDLETEKQDVFEELRIMSKVLEESLNRSILGKSWRGLPVGTSVFEPAIRLQYIPTVGAVFTIPVNFPISAPEMEKTEEKEEETEEKETDLWKKFSKKTRSPRDPFLPYGFPEDIPAPFNASGEYEVTLKDNLDEMKQKIEKMKKQALDQTENIKQSVQIQIPSQDEMVRDALETGAVKQYDEEKVKALRRTIIETLAQYGHRMTSIPDLERILVIVEAPGRGGDPGAGIFSLPQVHGQISDKNHKKVQIIDRYYSFSPFHHGAIRERLLFAVKKWDLNGEKTFEEMDALIEETPY